MKIILLQEQVKTLVATIKSEIKSGKIDAITLESYYRRRKIPVGG